MIVCIIYSNIFHNYERNRDQVTHNVTATLITDIRFNCRSSATHQGNKSEKDKKMCKECF